MDRVVVRMVVGGLLAFGLLSLLGIGWLSYAGVAVPDILGQVVVAALSATGAILARTGDPPAPPPR